MNQVVDPDAEPLEAIVVEEEPPNPAVVAVTWIGVAIVALVILWFAWTQVINPAGSSVVDQYANGDTGHLYESLRDQFRAEFPTVPTRRVLTGPYGSTTDLTSRPGPDYSFTVLNQSQPETALENYATTLNTAAGSLASQVNGEIISQSTPVVIQDVAVKFVVYRVGNEYYRNQLTLASNRLYTVQAKVRGKDEAPFHRLTKSFEILGPR
jgi:hypothetical protein